MGQMRVRRTGPWVKISCPFSWVQFNSPCGSRCGSNRHLCVKETTDGLRRHIPFGRFSLIIDSGDFLNESLLLLAGFRPRHAEFPAHRKKDTINKRSKLHRPHLLSSIPQSLQKIKWQIEAAAVTLFVLKTHRCKPAKKSSPNSKKSYRQKKSIAKQRRQS